MEYLSKSDVVTVALRELIIKGEFPAGTQLRQRDLAARFGVSPTPVREALRRLETEGLLDYDVHRGSTVIASDFGATEDHDQVRAALESLAARLAASRISEQELDELDEINRQQAACSDGRLEQRTDLNRQFHFTIYQASRSPLLLALLRLLWQAFPQGAQGCRDVAQSAKHHAAIIDALRAGDEDAAEQRTRDHILSARPASKRSHLTVGRAGGAH
jgi:DNA-binding GntR family transcriptional regulator